MEVRLDDVGDPQVRRARRVEVDVDVPTRVDDRGDPAASSATSVDRCPSPSIRYCVTRMGAAYTESCRNNKIWRRRHRPTTTKERRGADRGRAGVLATSSPGRRRRRGPGP